MSDLSHPLPLRTFRLVTVQQPDGTWYGALHGTGVCIGAYGFPSRDLAWSFAWDQQQALVRAAAEYERDEVDDCPADGTDFLDVRIDPRDPHPTREGMFRLHDCYRCADGTRSCVRDNPRQCEYPHARDD